MSMKLWPGYWNNQLESLNMRVDEDNGESVVIVNGWDQKFWRFQEMNF